MCSGAAHCPIRTHLQIVPVNSGYSARIHRDGNNHGPSLTRSFGAFTGGRLNYYGQDNGQQSFEELEAEPRCAATSLRTRDCMVLFDGTRAHSVEGYAGERFSLVFSTINAFARMRHDVLEFLISMGGGCRLKRAKP